MSAPKILTSYLPYTFSNGVTIRRFAKTCSKCGLMLESKHMRGLAIGDGDSLYIAAHARCPHCKHVFSVCCVVTDTRQVVKMPFPISVMKWWIRRSLRKRAADILNGKVSLPPADIIEEPAAAPVSLRKEDVVLSEEIIGYLGSLPIYDYFDYDGQRYYYSRVQPEQVKVELTPSEQLFCDVLIYQTKIWF